MLLRPNANTQHTPACGCAAASYAVQVVQGRLKRQSIKHACRGCPANTLPVIPGPDAAGTCSSTPHTSTLNNFDSASAANTQPTPTQLYPPQSIANRPCRCRCTATLCRHCSCCAAKVATQQHNSQCCHCCHSCLHDTSILHTTDRAPTSTCKSSPDTVHCQEQTSPAVHWLHERP